MAVTLSICIPTYNRSKCLKECLSSVLASIAGHEREIEIIISDNAGTDDTGDIVRAFQETHPWIRYHRNAQNIGGERNFRLLATLAQGENIWIFGDDDKMEASAVARVLDNISAGYNLTICNYLSWNKQFTVPSKKSGLPGEKDQSFVDSNALMKHFGLHLGYISSVVIKKHLFLKLPAEEYETFAEYGFPFLYAVYTGVAKGACRAGFIAEPVVCNRGGNSGDYDWYKYFVAGSSLIFEALLSKGYARDAVLHARRKVLVDLVIPNMLLMKLRDDYVQTRGFNLIFHHYKNDWLFWIACVPAWLMPAILVRSARNVVRVVRRVLFCFGVKKIEGPTNVS